MKKFAIAAATATALTLTMANAAFAQQPAQSSPMTLAAGEVTKAKEETKDTWITTKVKADLMTEKGIPGSDIKVETNKGVVSCLLTWRSPPRRKNRRSPSPRLSRVSRLCRLTA